MRITLLAVAALIAGLVGDVRPSAARAWYPWCAQYADRSGITSCAFTTFDQCLATVRGIGGSCVQNWHPAPSEPRYVPPRRHHAVQ
jgi:hypothetical protein